MFISNSNKNSQNKNFFNFGIKKSKKQMFLAIILSVLFNLAFFVINNFSSDFIFHKEVSSFAHYMIWNFLMTNDMWKLSQFYLYWIFSGILLLISCILVGIFVNFLIYFTYIDKWKKLVFDKHAEIINSCPNVNFNDKVALLVGVCNDFSPNTLLQSANQTYKNIDVWICDDSTKPESIKEIDEFVKKHKNFYVSRRDAEHKRLHKTKIGNTFYWLGKHGKNYDYIFENDSSSVVTSTFVENCLRYHHSPLLKDTKIAGIICNGNFYYVNNFISKLNSIEWQIGNEALSSFCLMVGSRQILDGWCCFYKTSTIMQIPLKDIECACCDSSRGLWLNQKGYVSVFNPFDFGAKFGIQNIQAYKNQRTKWMGSEYFVTRTRLSLSRNINNLYRAWYFIATILTFSLFILLTFINTVFYLSLNVVYFNYTCLLIEIGVFLLFCLAYLIFAYIRKINIIKVIFTLIILSILQLSIFYKRVWQFCVRGLLMHTESVLTCITKKSLYKTTFLDKLKMSIIDLSIILASVGICLALTLTLGQKRQINDLTVWFAFFPLLTAPSFVYIVLVWIGEIKIKNGYDPKMVNFPIEKYDFRYKWVKETEVWKKQHPNDK